MKLLEEMYKIIATNSYNDVNYAKQNIVGMIKYLEVESSDDKNGDYEELITAMRKKYRSMFPPRDGLTDFHIWRGEPEERRKGNYEYKRIKMQIEEIFEMNEENFKIK